VSGAEGGHSDRFGRRGHSAVSGGRKFGSPVLVVMRDVQSETAPPDNTTEELIPGNMDDGFLT